MFKNNFDSRSAIFVYYSWYFAAAWTLVIVALLLFGIIQIRSVQEAMVKHEARANFNKDQALRFWSAIHGGVYVPVDDDTPPNPHLKHILDRDIITPSGKSLTLMNPAYMLRQTMKEFEDLYGIRGHITSLQYFRPETAPDEWEKSALHEFEKGAKETFDYSDIDGRPYYRYMAPMITKKGCLKCHGHQGYKVGEVRGGVSVSVPMAPYLANQRRQSIVWSFSLGFLWLIGFITINLMARALSRRIKEKDKAEAELQKAHDELEKRVQERTADLEKEIKKRKKIELALKDAEARYRSIFEYAKSGIAVYKAIDNGNDFVFQDLNKKGEAIDNINRKDLIGNRISKMFPNVKDFGLLDVFQKVWETGEPEEFPLTFYEDERIIGWRDNFIYKLPSGEIVTIYRDETDRKRIEETLKKSEKKYRIIAENMANVVATLDMNLRFTYISPSIIRLRGFTVEEALAQTIDQTMTPDSFQLVSKAFEEELRLEGAETADPDRTRIMELEEYKKDGSTIWVEITSSFIRDEDRKPVGILLVSCDITERKRNKEQRDKLISDLQKALGEVKTLNGLLPICSYCKKIRDDKGYWNQIDAYIQDHSEAEFSHGICQECAKKYYPDLDIYDEDETQG